jgi:Na+/melibiose symporter-like transporter
VLRCAIRRLLLFLPPLFLVSLFVFAIEAISRRDYAVIQAVNLFVASLIVRSNPLVDLSYGALDPRVRQDESGRVDLRSPEAAGSGGGTVILTEAALSFLGFGVPPPRPPWGGVLSGPGLVHMLRAPWLAFWPGVAVSLPVFGANMLGDALRGLLDPRLRGNG